MERPQLLVSVRSPEEARTALAGGADIIDIKEPDRGSLGRARPDVIEAVAMLAGRAAPETPLSVALGEVREILTDHSLHVDTVYSHPPPITFAKLGLTQLRDDPQWVARWLRAREHVESNMRGTLKWIAVIYADEQMAQAPPALEVIDAARPRRGVDCGRGHDACGRPFPERVFHTLTTSETQAGLGPMRRSTRR